MSKEKAKSSHADKRVYLKQTDAPSASLEEALRIPQAIFNNYAGGPATPLQVAKALDIDPKGSQIKLLSGASIAFGLIEGGAQASMINVTDLARRIIRPQEENQDLLAKREAVLKPRVFAEFLQKYDGHSFPRSDLAINVLEEKGVPRNKAEEVLERIITSARSVGFIEEIKGKSYISLQINKDVQISTETDSNEEQEKRGSTEIRANEESSLNIVSPPVIQPKETALQTAIADDQRRRRVFITHGKNKNLLDPIKKLLDYGELEPVIAIEKTSVSKPVPEKVMNEMRGCGAAIIHVDIDESIEDKEGNFHTILNPNVMIEIGAAMAFYGKRFILLVRDGIQLPSNLQGLFEVRYTNDDLDAVSTIKLLEAIKDIKNYELPSDNIVFDA